MLSVIVPTRNSEEGLARTLSSLVSGAAEGVVREVVVVDDASTDGTRIVADAAGCTLVEAGGILAGDLSPIKARLALCAMLGAGYDLPRIAAAFAQLGDEGIR